MTGVQTCALPILQAGGDPGTRDRLENILNIFKRGMGKRPTAEIENKEIT